MTSAPVLPSPSSPPAPPPETSRAVLERGRASDGEDEDEREIHFRLASIPVTRARRTVRLGYLSAVAGRSTTASRGTKMGWGFARRGVPWGCSGGV